MVAIRNLTFSYGSSRKGNEHALFNKLSLSLKESNIYGLLGRNGAGKTTFLKIITGQLFKQAGEITVLGSNPARRLPGMLSKIYFLPEEFYLPSLTGKNYVKIYSSFYPDFNLELFAKYTEEFEIDSDKKLNSLSYGQKKKFLIAFGLSTGCRLIVLDEPTNGLDIPSKSQFRRLVSGSVRDNQTFIISTHQVRDLEHLIDPLIILDNGKIILNETIESISSRLSMDVRKEKPEGADVIYQEKTLGGYAFIRSHPSEGTTIDIEVLFNAVISGKDRIFDIFGSKKETEDETE